MLYNTGTIAINGNTATGTGTNWTAPASQVRAGQTIIVMSNPVQMFQISSVNSATSMTVTPAASPALSGQKYGILVSDNISVDGLAQAMSQLIKEYDENIGAWETFATTSANQTITVTINGASVNIPGIGALARKGVNSDITELKGLTTALSIAQGGTGATNAAGARAGIGLKNGFPIAEYNATNETVIDNVVAKMRGFSLATIQNSGGMTGEFYEIPRSAPTLWVGANDTWFLMSVHYFNRGIRIMSGYGSAGVTTTRLLLDNLSTTVDANGFIKKASPIARLTDNPEIMPASFLEDFKLSGYAGTNCEAEGVTAEKLSTGVYEVRGAKGLCSEGWTLEVPQDENGNRLCFVTMETSENGTVTVHVFKRRFDIDSAMIVAGEPMDIPSGRWIDLRLEMPENSIWNQRHQEVMA
ncbi:phage tail fiber protein [Enterobacter chengduensis]|uniref:phage tail fiber protein n=1 Tax=Enterobacter chengduensis TaxID=2494701 RepID=UPI003B981DEC